MASRSNVRVAVENSSRFTMFGSFRLAEPGFYCRIDSSEEIEEGATAARHDACSCLLLATALIYGDSAAEKCQCRTS